MADRSDIESGFNRFVEGSASPPREVVPDPEYDFIPPSPPRPKAKKGAQCGKCGMKFEYGQAYGYCCQHADCPCGYGSWSSHG